MSDALTIRLAVREDLAAIVAISNLAAERTQIGRAHV